MTRRTERVVLETGVDTRSQRIVIDVVSWE